MRKNIRTKNPFKFYTRVHLTESTGLRAVTLSQLAKLIKKVPGSCIYHHTHRFLQQHQYLSPEPPNDFAYWVTQVIGEHGLGELLASIDTVEFSTIRSLRKKIIETIEEYLKNTPLANMKFANEEEAFYFIKSISFILPTKYEASSILEFVEILKKISIDSIYYHIFESRLRLQRQSNDFSNWLGDTLNEKELADKISSLDPYTHTMEDLRRTIIDLIRENFDI